VSRGFNLACPGAVKAVVPRMCVRLEVERKLLAEVHIRQLKMPRSLYVVSRLGARLSHAAVGLMQLLQR